MTAPLPALSVVIPAYDAAATIGAALHSITKERDRYAGVVEIVVVDDGSADPDALSAEVARVPGVVRAIHDHNHGMCAARNTGIALSTGAIVLILDADDTLVPDWPEAMATLVAEWPADCAGCWAGCVNDRGEPTMHDPHYQGRLTAPDMLAERYTGEYLPLFRGDYIRARGYIDPGTRKSCGLLSYLTFLQDGPFWISPRALRLYNDRQVGSVTSDWTHPAKARESVVCLESVLARFDDAYCHHAPRIRGGKYIRLAIYRRLGGQRGAWRAFVTGIRHAPLAETVGAMAILIFGGRFCAGMVAMAKRWGWIKRYG